MCRGLLSIPMMTRCVCSHGREDNSSLGCLSGGPHPTLLWSSNHLGKAPFCVLAALLLFRLPAYFLGKQQKMVHVLGPLLLDRRPKISSWLWIWLSSGCCSLLGSDLVDGQYLSVSLLLCVTAFQKKNILKAPLRLLWG